MGKGLGVWGFLLSFMVSHNALNTLQSNKNKCKSQYRVSSSTPKVLLMFSVLLENKTERLPLIFSQDETEAVQSQFIFLFSSCQY